MILIAALAIYAVLLIVFNSKTVSVDFVFVTEKTRVIWLVLLSVALGALIMWLLRGSGGNASRERPPANARPFGFAAKR